MRDWERRLLLGLLWPVLWMQGKKVRRVTPRLPEAQGARVGTCGSGPLFRLLIAGDSGAAGVGVSTQDQALGGQLVWRLSRHHTVEWQVLAVNGLDSPGLLRLLQTAPTAPFDAVVLSVGANDVTCLCAPQRWLQWQEQLAEVIESRFAPGLLVHSAVPPMHACRAISPTIFSKSALYGKRSLTTRALECRVRPTSVILSLTPCAYPKVEVTLPCN